MKGSAYIRCVKTSNRMDADNEFKGQRQQTVDKPEVRLAAEIAYMLRFYLTGDEAAEIGRGRQPADVMGVDEMVDVVEEAENNVGIVRFDAATRDAAMAIAVSTRFDPSRSGADARVTLVRKSLSSQTYRVAALTDAGRRFLQRHAGGVSAEVLDFDEKERVADLMAAAGLVHYTSNSTFCAMPREFVSQESDADRRLRLWTASQSAPPRPRGNTGNCTCQRCGAVNSWGSDFEKYVGDLTTDAFLGGCRICGAKDGQLITGITPDRAAARAKETPKP